ncbi:hypothetical protein [Pseudomonas frederiksbergensis]|uniref:hypothetical protein n=1 Tax=Pseudomonas frederiksbergensis TaxID=104087 RepID=UPI0011CEB423|nr:hypothetical protein [Pseudomonas frederiksbergensis]
MPDKKKASKTCWPFANGSLEDIRRVVDNYREPTEQVQRHSEKKAADSSGFEDNFSKGRADEKCRGKQGDT